MADTKISALTDGVAPVSTDVSPWARSGANVKLSWSQMVAALGLGTMASQAAADYLTAVATAATYLTSANAASTYAPKASPVFTGVVEFPLGTSGAPPIHPTGKATSGIYWTSVDDISISVTGTERHRFGSGGLYSNTGGFSIGATVNGPDWGITRISAGSGAVTLGRWSVKQGSAVASANDVTLGTDGNRFQITGTTQINRILNTGWQGGSIVTLHFQGSVTVTHNTASGSSFQGIMLAGAASFNATADDQLTLQYDATAAKWYEIGRVVI